MTSGNNDTSDMRRRIRKAVQMYGMLRPKLMGDKDTTVHVKKRILESMIGSPVGGPHSAGEIRGAAAVNVLSRVFAFAAHGGALGWKWR